MHRAALALLSLLGLGIARWARRRLGTRDLHQAPTGQLHGVFLDPAGDDEAAGTARSPVASLPAAMERVAPHGSVTIRQGAYPISGPVVIDQPGVTVRPAAGAVVVFEGSIAVSLNRRMPPATPCPSTICPYRRRWARGCRWSTCPWRSPNPAR